MPVSAKSECTRAEYAHGNALIHEGGRIVGDEAGAALVGVGEGWAVGGGGEPGHIYYTGTGRL